MFLWHLSLWFGEWLIRTFFSTIFTSFYQFALFNYACMLWSWFAQFLLYVKLQSVIYLRVYNHRTIKPCKCMREWTLTCLPANINYSAVSSTWWWVWPAIQHCVCQTERPFFCMHVASVLTIFGNPKFPVLYYYHRNDGCKMWFMMRVNNLLLIHGRYPRVWWRKSRGLLISE